MRPVLPSKAACIEERVHDDRGPVGNAVRALGLAFEGKTGLIQEIVRNGRCLKNPEFVLTVELVDRPLGEIKVTENVISLRLVLVLIGHRQLVGVAQRVIEPSEKIGVAFPKHDVLGQRSEERRVGKECRSVWSTSSDTTKRVQA